MHIFRSVFRAQEQFQKNYAVQEFIKFTIKIQREVYFPETRF